ncbi:MAG: dihydroorotase [Betaproteobacteria bacterium]|nr:dihydroorotase [Betaproteobacteria bacterium]
MKSLVITRPDDWHLHLRDGPALAAVLPHTARAFARAIVMPNLKPPVTSVALAGAYRQRIVEAFEAGMRGGAIKPGTRFEPLMTLYLTDNTSPQEIALARDSSIVHAVKYYPAGATTNSDAGVSELKRAFPALEAMEKHDLPLLIHGEVTDPAVDLFDRERIFVESQLQTIVSRFPKLRVVAEHITTREAAQFVEQARPGVAATITVHHLMYNRGAIFQGGIRPHFYCLPVLKREEHRLALVAAATSGNPKFFLGTDSAPHPRGLKEHPCGCAGIFSAPAALEFYAEVFDAAGALEKLEAFASHHGADFYRLARNTDSVTLVQDAWAVPAEYPFGDETVVPLRANEQVAWRMA